MKRNRPPRSVGGGRGADGNPPPDEQAEADMDGNNHTQANTVFLKSAKRRCTDCGRPTTDYRCPKCWIKRRGFTVDECGGISELSTRAERAANAREKTLKATPPATAREPRQKPAQKAPQMPQEEKDMTDASQEYTLQDIADKAGVLKDCMWAAMKYIKAGNVGKSANAQKVRRVLDELGISWRDIKGVRGKSASAPALATPLQSVTSPQPERVPVAVPSAPSASGVKHDTGKLRLDLISPEITRALGEVLTFGAGKYGDRNWEAGLASDRLYAAVQRHLLAWREGEDADQESSLPHLAHALTTLGMLLTLEQRAARAWPGQNP